MRALSRASLALLCCGVLAALACSTDESRFDKHIERAEGHLEEGQARQALIELRSALRLKPDDADVNYRIARLAEATGSARDAIFFYGEVRRLDPTRSDAAIGEALLVVWSEPERAEELVNQVLERDPSYAPAYAARADLELSRANMDAALAAALTATELEPDSGLWAQKLGLVYAARIAQARSERAAVSDEDYARAAKSFERAQGLYAGEDPAGTWRPLFQRARIVAIWPGHEAEVMDAFRAAGDAAEASGSEAAQQEAFETIGEWARSARRPALRRWSLERLTGLGLGPIRAWVELARLEEAAGNPPEAVYERMLARRGDDVGAHLVYARHLASSGEADGAVAHLRRTAEQGIEPAAAMAGLVELLHQLGRQDEAQVVYAELQGQYGDHPRAMRVAAQQAIAERRFDEAVEVLGRLAEREDSPAVQRLLAVAEQRRGNSEEALRAVERGIALAGEPSPSLLVLRAGIEQGAGDWGAVLATLSQIRQARPLTTRERLAAARAHYAQGRDARARQVLEKVLQEEDAPVAAALLYSNRESSNQPERTREILEGMRKRYARAPTLVYELVRLDQEAGRSDQALARINAFTAETGQSYPQLLFARARINAERGENAIAQQDALRAFEAAPNTRGIVPLLISLYRQEGDLDEVIASFEEADKVGALGPTSRVLLAQLYMETGDETRARTLLETVVTERSDLATAKNDLAYLLARQGTDLDRALALAQEAQQRLGEDPAAADTVGYVYLRKKLHEPALEQFRYAIELAATSGTPRAEYHYHRGLALRALGRDREAVDALESALALDADFPEAGQARQELEAARAALGPGSDEDAQASTS